MHMCMHMCMCKVCTCSCVHVHVHVRTVDGDKLTLRRINKHRWTRSMPASAARRKRDGRRVRGRGHACDGWRLAHRSAAVTADRQVNGSALDSTVPSTGTCALWHPHSELDQGWVIWIRLARKGSGSLSSSRMTTTTLDWCRQPSEHDDTIRRTRTKRILALLALGVAS